MIYSAIDEAYVGLPKCDNENLSTLDSEIIDRTTHNHNYYIDRLLKNYFNDNASTSSDDELYRHIKSCKQCKTQINSTIKSKVCNNTIYGFSFKEALLMVFIGILLVFIIDLFRTT